MYNHDEMETAEQLRPGDTACTRLHWSPDATHTLYNAITILNGQG